MSDTTTVAAEPSEQPDAQTPVSPLRRALVWATTIGVVAVGTLGLAASDLVPPPAKGGLAARFLPADGSATLWTDSDGHRSVHENARDTGPGLLLELPANAAYGVFAERSSAELGSIELWRETVAYLDEPDNSPVSTVYLVDDAGVSLLTATGGSIGFAYSPALVVLPADAAPGVAWSGEGAAMPAGLLEYRSTGEVTDAGDGCLLASTDTRYLDPDTGAELLAVQEQATWCPGRGIVRDVGVVDGEEESYVSSELPVPGGYGSAVDTRPARYTWEGADRWRARDLEFVIADPGFGDSPQGSPFDGLAATTADGTLVASVGSRLASYRVDGGAARRGWLASPGGDLLALSAVGEVTLVSTAQRRLIAYDGSGARLWSVSFPDVVLAAPAPAPDGDIVAVSLDGTLRRIDLATGETVWSTTLRTDVATTPAVGAGLVVVVDRGGAVMARSLGDGSARWSTELSRATRAAAGEGVVAVQGGDAAVWVLDPHDGALLWKDRHRGSARGIVVSAGVVVAQSDEGTAAWAVDGGGERLWTSDAGEQLLAGDGVFVLGGASTVEVRSPAGELLGEVELGEAPLGVTRVIVPTPHGIRVVHSNTTGLEVRG